jgi:hypothetical protein
LEFKSNTLETYPLFFESEGVHNLTLTVAELGVSKYSLINVTKYSSEIPWINPNERTLSLYLTPQNKSNNSVDKKVWYDYKKVHKAQLDDNMVFSSASGWLVDDDNISHLRLTSGSSLVLPTYKPFENDPTAPKVGSNKG